MADSQDETPTKSDEERCSNSCSPCSETGSIKEAKKYCVQCGIYFCDQCLQDHNKFPALRSHKVVDKCGVDSQSDISSTEADEPTERCLLHRGQVLDRFCHDHDKVCCEACFTIKHRSCAKVDNIKEVARGVTSRTEYKDIKASIENVITRIQQQRDQRNNNVASLGEDKKQALRNIDKFQDDMINRIKEIANSSKQEVESKRAEHVNVTQSNTKELETVLTVTQETSKKINAVGLNEAEIFTNIKHGKKIVRDIYNSVDELSSHWHPKQLGYCIDTEASKTVQNLKAFGQIIEANREYRATSFRKVNVKMKTDKETCVIGGICILEDGTYVVSDFSNNNLKRLNKDFEVLDYIDLTDSLVSVCTTGQQEVAAALREEKRVQFVACGEKLSLGSSFETELRCCGVYFDSTCDELYVSCGAKELGDKKSKVNVYKKDGTLLRSYENDESGSRLFSSPKNIVMVTTIGIVYVADRENGLITIHKSGKKLWVYNDSEFKGPWGVCLLPGHQLLVTDYISKNILQIGADGNKVCEVVGASEGLNNPYTMTYDRRKSMIIVGCRYDEIRLFQLSRD